MVKKLLKIVPVIYVVIVIWSYAQIHNYYAYYDIAINPYVSIYELLFYFIPYFLINYVNIFQNLGPLIRTILILLSCLIIALIIFLSEGKTKGRKFVKYFDEPKQPDGSKLFYKVFFSASILIFAYLTFMIISFYSKDFKYVEFYMKQGHSCFIIIFLSWCFFLHHLSKCIHQDI
jgi:hypothetical protein